MNYPGDLERILAGAAGDGWNMIEQVADPKIQARLKLVMAKREEDAKTIAQAWARFASTPDGAMALDALFSTTLLRTTYFVGLGTDALQVAQFGAFREGQNALAHEIARQVVKGRDTDEQLKPRDMP